MLLEQLSKIEPRIPLYIDDGRNLENALKWSLGRNVLKSQKKSCPIIISTDRTYSTDDLYRDLSPNQLINLVNDELHEVNNHNSGSVTDLNGATSTFVSSYSNAMSPETQSKCSIDDRNECTRQFGRYQVRRWSEKTNGSIFWAWNATRLRDKGYDFKTQVEQGSVYCPAYFRFTENQVRQKLKEADSHRSQLMTTAMERHIAYFEKVGGKYEHWRYADGWHLGFTDARAFFAFRLDFLDATQDIVGADRIGALDLWVLKRMKEENSVSRDRCEFVWEWEHGFRAGVRAFYKLVGIS